MSCTYTIYDKTGIKDSIVNVSIKELIQYFKDNKKQYIEKQSIEDILYSQGQDQVTSSLLNEKLNQKASRSKTELINDPEYNNSDQFSPSSLIDSGNLRILGNQIMPEKRQEDYEKNLAIQLKEENPNMSDSEIQQIVKSTISNQDKINKDGFDLHCILNNFGFYRKDSKVSFVDSKMVKDSRFNSVSGSLFDQIDQKFMEMWSNHKSLNGTSAKIIQNVTLKGFINNTENGLINKEIVGHYDNIVIDEKGDVHIYNYRVSSTSPVHEYNVKREKYTLMMALLKQILANNGYNVRNITMHYIPIQLKYNDDFSQIESIIVHNSYNVAYEKSFKKMDTVAKAFIQSKVNISPIQSSTIEQVNTNLKVIFPDKQIYANGISKTVEQWIKEEYSGFATSRIRKVTDEEGVYYKLYLKDDFSDPIKITSKEPPIKNQQIIQYVEEYLSEKEQDRNARLKDMVDQIIKGKRIGLLNINLGPFGQQTASYLNRVLKPYISDGIKVDDETIYDWELISDDTLLESNILLFKNRSGVVDVVVLSNFDLNSQANFKGQKNIMGSYFSDMDPLLQEAFNYDSSYGNIEAVRVMTLLNEVLPQLQDKDVRMGKLQVISSSRHGQSKIFSFERLNKELFQNVIRLTKIANPQFQYKNNFSEIKYVDPLQVLAQTKEDILSNQLFDNVSLKQNIKELSWPDFESQSAKEQKLVQLRALAESMVKSFPELENISTDELIEYSKGFHGRTKKILSQIYMQTLDAIIYYSNTRVDQEKRISKLSEYGFKANRVPNKTFRSVVGLYIKTVDTIAMEVRQRYNPIFNYITRFYDSSQFSNIRNAVLGDQVNAFKNMFRVNENNEMLMEFRNPYKTDSQTQLTEAEKSCLKNIIYDFTQMRCELYGKEFNFNRSDINSQEYIDFLERNPWAFNVPLKRASKATVRSKGFEHAINEKWKRTKEFWKNKNEILKNQASEFLMPEELSMYEQAFDNLTIANPYMIGDGYPGSEDSRKTLLGKYGTDYFETNIENLLADYIDKLVQLKEYKKTLITVRGILLQNALIGDIAGESNKEGISQTEKMIKDYVKINFFKQSIMEPESIRMMSWLKPFRELVSNAYIAGNITSAFRDIFNGFLENMTRAITKYQTDGIKTAEIIRSYKDVILASFTSARDITIIDELCKTYRLSNLDVARISEGLTTSHCGILNIENWLYSTLRTPDFLNRMVLFVAKCRTDGSWDAFTLNQKTRQLEYNWKKDKRYSAYADKSKKGTKEYEDAKVAYYNAIRIYNSENPEHTIDFTEDLPVAYSNEEMRRFRELSNSIYGAYDQSLKSKYEFIALGQSFGVFTTWMNGMTSNYFAAPGIYEDSEVQLVQDTDGSGNNKFMDEQGISVIEVHTDNGIKYIYEETGEEYQKPIEDLVKTYKNIPLQVQGIFNTLRSFVNNVGINGFDYAKNAIKISVMDQRGLEKGLADLLMSLLFFLAVKLALTPKYREYKKEMAEHSLFENALAEIMYGGISKSGDSFAGPVGLLTHIGTSNPPQYKATLNLITNIGQATFGDRTWTSVLTNNIALARPLKYTLYAEDKKAEKIKKTEQEALGIKDSNMS